jgi:hypothetical protein
MVNCEEITRVFMILVLLFSLCALQAEFGSGEEAMSCECRSASPDFTVCLELSSREHRQTGPSFRFVNKRKTHYFSP